ncbi:7580_t:CDS:1, partial [Diversispora eburnea]
MVGPISISFIILAAVIFAFTTFDNPVTCSLPTCIDADDDDNNTTCQVMMEDESYDTDVETIEYDYFRDYDWSYEENYDTDDSSNYSSGTTI